MSRRVFLSASVFVLAGACSVFNKFDALQDVHAAAGSSNGGGTNTGGSGGSDAGGQTGSTGGSGGNGGTTAAPPGLVVVLNKSGTQGFLSVLSPQSGAELAREQGAFLGVVRDDANDLWFVLTDDQGSIFPDTSDTVSLQARTFDRATNAWTKLGTPLTIPVPVGPLDMGMLVKRLAILTYELPTDAGASGTKQFIVVDTSNPAALTLTKPSSFSSGYVDIDQDVTHLITSYSGNNAGGLVTIVRRSTTLDISLRRYTVSSSDVNAGATTPPIGTLPANNAAEGTAWNPDPNTPVILSVIPVDQQNATVRQLGLIDYSSFASDIQLTLTAPVSTQLLFSPPAFDPCTDIAFVAELRDTHSVFAIPISGSGTIVRRDLGHSGQQVAFEPYTRSVLGAYTSGNASGISAYTLGGTPTSPALAPRTDWNPPSDLKPAALLVERPIPAVCQ